MMVDIIITHRGAPGFSASAVRNPLVKAEPSTQNEAAAKNGFQPSFWSRGQNLFSESKSPPLGGGSSDGKWFQCNRSTVHLLRGQIFPLPQIGVPWSSRRNCPIYDG